MVINLSLINPSEVFSLAAVVIVIIVYESS